MYSVMKNSDYLGIVGNEVEAECELSFHVKHTCMMCYEQLQLPKFSFFQQNTDLILVFVMLRREPEMGGGRVEGGGVHRYRRLTVVETAERGFAPTCFLIHRHSHARLQLSSLTLMCNKKN